jgi:hypothetical protein
VVRFGLSAFAGAFSAGGGAVGETAPDGAAGLVGGAVGACPNAAATRPPASERLARVRIEPAREGVFIVSILEGSVRGGRRGVSVRWGVSVRGRRPDRGPDAGIPRKVRF